MSLTESEGNIRDLLEELARTGKKGRRLAYALGMALEDERKRWVKEMAEQQAAHRASVAALRDKVLAEAKESLVRELGYAPDGEPCTVLTGLMRSPFPSERRTDAEMVALYGAACSRCGHGKGLHFTDGCNACCTCKVFAS